MIGRLKLTRRIEELRARVAMRVLGMRADSGDEDMAQLRGAIWTAWETYRLRQRERLAEVKHALT